VVTVAETHHHHHHHHHRQSVSQSVSQSASQPASQSTSQPTNQPVNQPTNQPTNQPIIIIIIIRLPYTTYRFRRHSKNKQTTPTVMMMIINEMMTVEAMSAALGVSTSAASVSSVSAPAFMVS